MRPMYFLLFLTLVFGGLAAAEGKKAPRPPRTATSAITPFNRNPARHETFLQRIKDGPVGLLFLGDSITDFWPRSATETWAKFDTYKPADFGIAGERTEDVLWRITNGELDGIDPKAVVLMIGTNNIGHFRDEAPEWTAAGVQAITATIREKLPKAKILLLGVFPRSPLKTDASRVKVSAINEIIKAEGQKPNTTYLDITEKFLDADGTIIKNLMPDALHPNKEGYEVWYNAMWPTLEPLLK